MRTWGSTKLHIGVGAWHARIGAFDRVGIILGRNGSAGKSLWVFGGTYEPEESVLLIGIPGLVLAIYTGRG